MKRTLLSTLLVIGALQAARAAADEPAAPAEPAAPPVVAEPGPGPGEAQPPPEAGGEAQPGAPDLVAQEAPGEGGGEAGQGPGEAGGAEATPKAPAIKSGQLLELPKEAQGQKPAAPAAAPAAPAPTTTGIVMNFQDADLNTVLDYLSKAAGFVVVKSGPLNGRVSAAGLQPVSAEDALKLLDTMLAQHDYIAVRNDRILRIVPRGNAMSEDLPVRRGSDPNSIPKSDEMVIQIIPLQYLSAEKLLENLRPLVSNPEAMTANAAGNAIIMTDSLARIHRVAAVIQALDTSISSITTVRVFPLQYAKADDIVKVIEKIFKSPGSSQSSSNQQGGFPFPFGGRGGMGGGGGNSNSDSKPASAYAVTAAGDTNTNSLVISAPEQLMPSIAEVVKQLDIPTQEAVTLQVFTLKYADAEKVVTIINSVYAQQSTASSGRNSSQGGFGGGFRSFMAGMGGGGGGNNGGSSSGRQLQAGSVSAAADTQTNSVIVSASKSILAEIGTMIEKIDATPARSERVFIHKVRFADLDRLQSTLESLFDAPAAAAGTTSRRSSTSSSSSSFGRGTSNSGTSSSFGSGSSSSGSRSSGGGNSGFSL